MTIEQLTDTQREILETIGYDGCDAALRIIDAQAARIAELEAAREENVQLKARMTGETGKKEALTLVAANAKIDALVAQLEAAERRAPPVRLTEQEREHLRRICSQGAESVLVALEGSWLNADGWCEKALTAEAQVAELTADRERSLNFAAETGVEIGALRQEAALQKKLASGFSAALMAAEAQVTCLTRERDEAREQSGADWHPDQLSPAQEEYIQVRNTLAEIEASHAVALERIQSLESNYNTALEAWNAEIQERQLQVYNRGLADAEVTRLTRERDEERAMNGDLIREAAGARVRELESERASLMKHHELFVAGIRENYTKRLDSTEAELAQLREQLDVAHLADRVATQELAQLRERAAKAILHLEHIRQGDPYVDGALEALRGS